MIKKVSKYVNVSCPSIVTTQNQFMGGFDLLDGLLSLYRIHIRSKKWYHKLLYHFFDIAVVQLWLLYWRDLFLSIPEIGWMPLRSFEMSIANSLLMKDKSQRDRTPGRSTFRLEKDLSAKKRRGPAAQSQIN